MDIPCHSMPGYAMLIVYPPGRQRKLLARCLFKTEIQNDPVTCQRQAIGEGKQEKASQIVAMKS